MQVERDIHLTYCTNIHPSHGWGNVFANLKQYAPALKQRLAPEQRFGIGLRLSGTEAQQLLEGDHLAELKDYLQDQGLYVFTINGFPQGDFHNTRVKDNVHAPDWRSDERVEYTLRLIDILAQILPEDLSEGSISTSPLSYKPWVDKNDSVLWQELTRQLLRTVEAMVKTRQTTGKHIHLDLEPEPDGLIENSVELVAYFNDYLLTYGADQLAATLGITPDAAREHLLNHVQVCFDTCHVAVAYEDPAEVLKRYAELGIQVGKVQISSALRAPLPETEREETRDAFEKFAESTYLHQVLQRNADGSITQYPDLPEALPTINNPNAKEWRVHFHVPIFLEEYGTFYATQAEITQTLELLKANPFTRHLEIETYTWDVLPHDLKTTLGDSIAREFEWVLQEGAFK